jgi:endonuclease YncB( thermonuclease family)
MGRIGMKVLLTGAMGVFVGGLIFGSQAAAQMTVEGRTVFMVKVLDVGAGDALLVPIEIGMKRLKRRDAMTGDEAGLSGESVIKYKNQIVQVRGIFCPRKGQPFFKEALEFTKEKTLGKQVLLRSGDGPTNLEYDKFHRLLGDVNLSVQQIAPGLTVSFLWSTEDDLACQLVKEGLAAWDGKQGFNAGVLKALQEEAKAQEKGIWSKKKKTKKE